MLNLDARQPEIIQQYLNRRGWINDDEPVISLQKPGEGNMNYTLRVRTGQIDGKQGGRSLIIKQSRPYVEKYPSIAAPAERAVIEGLFYRKTESVPALSACQPQLLDLDPDNNILVMEDLGEASDFASLYQPGETISDDELTALIHYLSTLHNQFRQAQPDPAFANPAMRALNHEHIFRYPFMVENGFDLDTVQPGLQAAAMPYKENESLKQSLAAIGSVYLGHSRRGAEPTLLHGDYYPGSWLRTANGVRIIDPEFCFFGPAEFDLGVLLAHLYLSDQPARRIEAAQQQYTRPEGFDEPLLRQFTGIEIMRRLIGLAQLPLSLSLEKKVALLRQAADLVS